MPANRNEKGDSPMKRRGGRRRKKVCVFCADKENKGIDYKDVNKLKRYVNIIPFTLSQGLRVLFIDCFSVYK